MMKIIFIETPSPWLVRKHVQIPLGPLYLATILKINGHEVRILRPDTIKDLKPALEYDLICFSGTTLEYPMNVDCAKWIREQQPDKKIIIGGVHASALPDEVIEDGIFDSVCIGEGESVILTIVDDAEKNHLKKIYRSEHYIDDLDTIPFPDRSLVPNVEGGALFAYNKNYIGSGNQNFITARGCPFECAFCASKSMWNGGVRFRSSQNIIDEMKYIIETTNVKQFRICDDNVTSAPKKCFDFCDAIIKNNLNIVWRCSVRAESLSEEIVDIMKKSGCMEISPGIESGDQRVLDFLNKKTTVEEMYEGCENAKNAGIAVRALMMIGTPGEREDTPEINYEYLKSLPHDMSTLSTFIPLPGTDIWNNPGKYKCSILSKDYRKYNKDYWVFNNGKAQKRKYEPLIHNQLLTLEKQIDNVKRMEEYIERLGRYNKG